MRLAQLTLCLLGLIGFTFAKTHTWYYKTGWVEANPDGMYTRQVIGWNGTWPLPNLRVKKGDTVNLYLTNGFDDRNTSLHFHGLFQHGSSQMDGPEMVTQCPIPPGSTFLYNFTVSGQAGTYWYHLHTAGQYGEGMRAAFIIEDDEEPPFEYDEEVILTVSEWYHKRSDDLLKEFMSLYNPTGAEPIPDSLLFNDLYEGSWEVKPNTTYFLRIINVGRFVLQYLYMEDHEFEIVEIDGIYVQPNTTDLLYITTAQRYGVLVRTKPKTDKNYAFVCGFDDTMLDVIPEKLALNVTNQILYSKDNERPKEIYVDSYDDFFDDFYLRPLSNALLLPDPDHRVEVFVEMNNLGNGVNYAFFNNITYTKPLVPTLHTVLSAGEHAANALVYGTNTHTIVLQKDEIVEIVLNNHDTGKHPFHLHGHVFQLAARYPSVEDDEPWVEYNASSPDNAPMPEYPAIRDTVYVNPQAYIVLRFKADNPGVWFFHCHLEWHLDQGLALVFVEAPEEIQNNLTQQLTQNHIDVCKAVGMAYEGNAAANEANFLDLKGQNVQQKALPAGFTARGIVALVFSVILAVLGMAAIAYYGMTDIVDIDQRVVRDLDVDLQDELSTSESSEIVEESTARATRE